MLKRNVAAPILAMHVLVCPFSTIAGQEVTRETIANWMQELSNTGRWGAEDQLGTLNLVDTAKRQRAALLVQDGISVSLLAGRTQRLRPTMVTLSFLK